MISVGAEREPQVPLVPFPASGIMNHSRCPRRLLFLLGFDLVACRQWSLQQVPWSPQKTQSSWRRAGGPKKKPFVHQVEPQVHPSTQEMAEHAAGSTLPPSDQRSLRASLMGSPSGSVTTQCALIPLRAGNCQRSRVCPRVPGARARSPCQRRLSGLRFWTSASGH